MELEHAIDERRRALDHRGSKLEGRAKRVEELEKETECVLFNLVVSTRPLRHLVRIHGPSLFFGLSSSVCWATRHLHSSNPSSSTSNTNSSTTTPSSPIPPQRSPRRDWEARRDLYLSTGGWGSYLVLVGIGVCAVVLKVPVRRLTGVGM